MRKCNNRVTKVLYDKGITRGAWEHAWSLAFHNDAKLAMSQWVSIYLTIKVTTSYFVHRPRFIACVKANLLLKGLRLLCLGGGR